MDFGNITFHMLTFFAPQLMTVTLIFSLYFVIDAINEIRLSFIKKEYDIQFVPFYPN